MKTRLEILKDLIKMDFEGNQKVFAKAIRKSPAQVNQWVTGHRNIGNGSARHIEMSLRLGEGYLDGKSRATSKHNNVYAAPDVKGLVPLISWVQAGQWSEVVDNLTVDQAEQYLPCIESHSNNTYALRVQGDSMTSPHGRSYPEGCIIFVDPDQKLVTNGDRVIAKINGDNAVTFKQYVQDGGQTFLKPLNPQYPILIDKFKILGKIIGTWLPE